MTYIVMVNYGACEGWSIQGEYATLDMAVKEGIANSYGSEFMIVQKVDWQATPSEEITQTYNGENVTGGTEVKSKPAPLIKKGKR